MGDENNKKIKLFSFSLSQCTLKVERSISDLVIWKPVYKQG